MYIQISLLLILLTIVACTMPVAKKETPQVIKQVRRIPASLAQAKTVPKKVVKKKIIKKKIAKAIVKKKKKLIVPKKEKIVLKKKVVVPEKKKPIAVKKDIEKSVIVYLSTLEAQKLNLSEHKYFVETIKLDDDTSGLVYKSDASIGRLRNIVALDFKKMGVKIDQIVSRFGYRKRWVRDKRLLYDFGCRVELASIFTKIVISKELADSGNINNCWSGQSIVYKGPNRKEISLGAVTMHDGKKMWGISYHTGSSLESSMLLRTTLDAIEFRLQRGDLGIVSVDSPIGRNIAASKDELLKYPGLEMLFVDWSSIALVANNPALIERISKVRDEILSGDIHDKVGTLSRFLVQSGLYKAVIESVGIVVP